MAASDRGKSQLSLILDGYNFKSYINTIGREELLEGNATEPGSNSLSIRNNRLGEISDTLFSLSNSPIYTKTFVDDNKFGNISKIGKHLQVTFENISGNIREVTDLSIGTGVGEEIINLENLEKNSFRATLRSKLNIPASRLDAINYNLQGFRGEEDTVLTSTKSFSIKKTLSISEDNTTINNNPNDKPTKDNPHLATYQIFDESLSIGNRQTAELAAFFNLIPTIEFSRAVPIIAAKFSLPAKTFKSRNNTTSQFSVANNADFLYGSENKNSKESMQAYRGDSFFKTISNRSGDDVQQLGISTNLDIFLAPQTMVNADEKYVGLDGEFTAEGKKSFDRPNPVIDKMRPFMSIESFDIDVKPTRGLLSYKTAQLNLVLHDRSRMADIAPFIKPDLFGTFGAEISIEYGWAHPDGSNPFGAMLNLMRAREKYMIVNSNFNLQQTGEVKISLSLAMLGATDIINTDVFGNHELQSAMKAFSNLLKSFKGTVESYQNRDIGSRQQSIVTDAASIANSQDAGRSFLRKLNKFIEARIAGEIPDILKARARELKTNLEAVNQKKSNLFRKFNQIMDNKYDPYLSYEVLRRIKIVKEDGAIDDPGNDSSNKSISDYVSFGKVILALIGKDLTISGRFNEVQLIFYNTNSKCSSVSSVNIANLPIRKKDLKDYLDEVIKKRVSSFSMGNLVLTLSKRFIENKASILYGFQGIFQYDPKTGGTKVPNNIAQRKAVLSQKEILYKIYHGEETYDLLNTALSNDSVRSKQEEDAILRKVDFVIPKIGFSTEVIYKSDVNRVNNLNVSPEPIFSFKSSNEEDDTILRVHIFDKSNTPFQGAYDFINQGIKDDFNTINNSLIVNRKDLLGTSAHDKLQEFNTRLNQELNSLRLATPGDSSPEININTRFGSVKQTYKKIMPSLTYGSQNSAIINASFQTINEGRLSTVFITRADREIEVRQRSQESTIKVGADELPLRVLPAKADLTTFGCPVINFAQSLFFDFGTGTSIDNLYNVTGIKHSIAQGKFESGLTLQYGDIYGKFESKVITELELSSSLSTIAENIRLERQRVAQERAALERAERQAAYNRLPPGSEEFLMINLFEI